MVYISILLFVFLADLMLKKYVEANYDEETRKYLFGKRIIVRKLHNDGIALGKLADYKEEVRRSTFGVMIAMLVYFFFLLFRKGNQIRKLGLSIFLGGALCNWFDRFHQRTVTDYFSFNVKWKKLRSLVFNLSDLCIVAGLLLSLVGKKRK